jgi:hypothetical protein
MANSPSSAKPSTDATAAQRHVQLQRAVIQTDQALLHRTAEFTDGSTGKVEMQWPDVRRVAAFRRNVLTHPVLCVAISDPSNIVVLDEAMDGWEGLLKELSRILSEPASFSQWRDSIQGESTDSYWTVLFRAGG